MRLQQLLLVTAVLWAGLGGGVEAKKKSRSLQKEQDGEAEPKTASRPGAPVVRSQDRPACASSKRVSCSTVRSAPALKLLGWVGAQP